MNKTFSRTFATLPALALLPVLALVLLLAGCHRDPQRKTLELRARHGVELLAAQVREANPLAAGAVAADQLSARAAETDALSAATGAEETGSEEPGADPGAAPVAPQAPPGPRPVEVEFEISLTRGGEESLPGITLDVSQSDPFKVVKKTYRRYLELPAIAAGEARRLTFRMPAEDFVDGDVFAVAVRDAVPPEERAAYRELQ